ncbi:hypothetical protein A2U01_0043735, partial [Trifolium medium]|nr:hypothetical protein [Trifolium medium]
VSLSPVAEKKVTDTAAGDGGQSRS